MVVGKLVCSMAGKRSKYPIAATESKKFTKKTHNRHMDVKCTLYAYMYASGIPSLA
jgi:hypothetical protein